VCDERLSCCEHAASALTVHLRLQTLLLTRLSALLQTGTRSEWVRGEKTNDGAVHSKMEQEIEQERHNILELPFVSGISDMVNGKGCGCRVNLRCHVARQHGSCEAGSISVCL